MQVSNYLKQKTDLKSEVKNRDDQLEKLREDLQKTAEQKKEISDKVKKESSI